MCTPCLSVKRLCLVPTQLIRVFPYGSRNKRLFFPLNIIKLLVFVVEMERVFCEVRTEFCII
jgi:hypothetical protein